MGPHGWLVKTYLWALAIIFNCALFLACVFDLVGMGVGVSWNMCLQHIPRGADATVWVFCVLWTPGLQQGEVMSSKALW